MNRKVLAGSFSGVAQVLVNIGITTLTIPIFINKLGMSTYGIYALITAIGSIGVFTNFGFNTSLIKYLAEQGKQTKSNYDIAVTFIIIGGMTSCIAILTMIFHAFVLQHILGLSVERITAPVLFLYYCCCFSNVFQMLNQIPSAILDAQQKVYMNNAVQIGVGIFSKSLFLIVLLFSPDLQSIGWVVVSSALVNFIILVVLCRLVWGKISCPELSKWFLPVAKKHFSYGRTIYGTSLVNFFYEPLTKVLLNRYLGLVEVGFFDLALKIRLLISSILDRMIYPFLPLVAQIIDKQRIREIIGDVQEKILLLLIPLVVGVIFMTKPVITLWLGKNIEVISYSVIAVVIVNLFSNLLQPVYFYLAVKGYPEKTLVMQLDNVGMNLLLFWLLTPLCGYYGALGAYCLALASSVALCGWYQWKYLGNTVIQSRNRALHVILYGSVLILSGVVIQLFVQADWLKIIFLTVVICAMSIFMIRLLKMITEKDLLRYIGDKRGIAKMLYPIFITHADELP